MARTVQLACARCGNSQMYVVDPAESNDVISAVAHASGGSESTDDASVLAEIRRRRLELLPTSLPVGGIITPV